MRNPIDKQDVVGRNFTNKVGEAHDNVHGQDTEMTQTPGTDQTGDKKLQSDVKMT